MAENSDEQLGNSPAKLQPKCWRSWHSCFVIVIQTFNAGHCCCLTRMSGVGHLWKSGEYVLLYLGFKKITAEHING